MAGSQFKRTRTFSSSPKLKCSDRSRTTSNAKKEVNFYPRANAHQSKNSSEIPPLMQQCPTIELSKQGSITPFKPGKRRHQAIISPVTIRSESSSPKAKLRTSVKNSRVATTNNFSLSCNHFEFYSFPTVETSDSSLAVPKVCAEPPNPSLLPSPPSHWVDGNNSNLLTQKLQCRAVTKCLMSHLASSGILIAA